MILYLVFTQIFGRRRRQRHQLAAMIMVSMAAYGSLGAAMSGGAQLAVERRSGWFRQLTSPPCRPRVPLGPGRGDHARRLPALLLVFAAGFVVGGVRAPVPTWLAALGLMWLALIPLAVLGMVIGVWVKAEVVQGLTTLILLVLSMLGGLWFPVQIMPARCSRRAGPALVLAGRAGPLPVPAGCGLPVDRRRVLLAWSGLTVLGALGYRRAAANSKR